MYSSLNNPTDEQRHEMLRKVLENTGRPQDYEFIVRFLSPSPDINDIVRPEELHGVKIGIIGGGLAGMCAAYELRKTGADITIFEASNTRIGGRVNTFYFDSGGKYYGELGALRIPATHETTWHYINLFGLDTRPMASTNLNNFLYIHSTRLRASGAIEQFIYPKYNLTAQEKNTPWSTLNTYANTCRFLKLSPETRSELIRILPEYSPDILPLMEMSLRENYEGLGLSQGAINLISGADPVSGLLFPLSYDEIAREIYTIDFNNLYRIQGGNVSLPIAFCHSFDSDNPPGYIHNPSGNVTYKMGHIATGIYQSDYRNKVVIKYKNKAAGPDAADIFDYIICSIPFTTLRTLEIKPYFSNAKMQAILELNYIDSMKSLFFCSKRFWERKSDYGNISGGTSYTDLPIQAVMYPEDAVFKDNGPCSSEKPGVLIAAYNLAQNATRLGAAEDRDRYEIIRQNVEEVHGLPRGYLTPFVEMYKTIHWNSEPLFRGAFAFTLPGQKRLFSYEMQQPEYNGRVFFAGEHVSGKHGWMQGALSSGRDAANRLALHFHNHY